MAAQRHLILSQYIAFQHTATRRWLPNHIRLKKAVVLFQHTATRRWLPTDSTFAWPNWRFNTQPPEGGCKFPDRHRPLTSKFQHTATRRWLPLIAPNNTPIARGFNTQPPEGGCSTAAPIITPPTSFNTQPPEGGCLLPQSFEYCLDRFQHTATRRWLPNNTAD